MNTERKGVDVLNVLDAARYAACEAAKAGTVHFSLADAAEISEARAAVAELISEAQAVLDHVEDEAVERVGSQCTLCYSYRARLRAALARVGGA